MTGLTQLEPFHSVAQEVLVDPECGVLLSSCGALPFAAPSDAESLTAWCARDTGWRHGSSATVLMIASSGMRDLYDDYAKTLSQQIDIANEIRERDVDVWLAEFHHMAWHLIHGATSERDGIAVKLARSGPAAWQLLATLAVNDSLAIDVRLAAADVLDEGMPRELLEWVALSFLQNDNLALRGHGMMLCARLCLTALEPLVRTSVGDSSSFQSGDVCVGLGKLAQAALHVLLSYRPDPSFPDWETVAKDAPRMDLDDLEDAAEPDDIDWVYLAMRQQLFGAKRKASAHWRLNFVHHAFGMMMETGYPLGTHTVAYFIDGDAHNHMSNGLLDVVTAGKDREVCAAGEKFLAQAQLD